MTAPDFRAALERLELTQRGFARVCGCNERTVRRWALGEQDIPKWVELMAVRFGPDAVPGNPALRPIYGDQVLSRNHELIDRERLNDLARHNRLVEVVKALEAAFAEHKAQQDQAFVEFLAEYLRRNQET